MDINKLMANAQAMQKQMERASEEMNKTEFTGTASNGLVKVAMTGDFKVKSVNISADIMSKDDKEMVEDLIAIAFNEALGKIEERKNELLNVMAKKMSIR
ncbi:MAG: YbaB/EbfC family nucleoid-associated protein [Erysipelotrichaceae bacterium]|nr:YbaB/EbfC family nucleoid-associated protein [Erysipelotrichaceae bacterium]